MHLPFNLKPNRWNMGVIDLHEAPILLGVHPEEVRLVFRVSELEMRANSRVKGIYQSDCSYQVNQLPKDMQMPLPPGEDFFQKYHFFVQSHDHKVISHCLTPPEIGVEVGRGTEGGEEKKEKSRSTAKKPPKERPHSQKRKEEVRTGVSRERTEKTSRSKGPPVRGKEPKKEELRQEEECELEQS